MSINCLEGLSVEFGENYVANSSVLFWKMRRFRVRNNRKKIEFIEVFAEDFCHDS